jgi:hypothetical protein
MNIKEDGDGYKVESGSRKGKWYSVDPKKPWCDCAAYKFRELKRKGVCKHIKAVREFVERTQQETIEEAGSGVLEYIDKEGGEVDAVELVERFGEDKVDSLIQAGEIIEKRGKIKILK